MSKVAPVDRAHLGGFQREDCRRMTIKREKLNLIGFAVTVHVNHRAHIASFET